MSRKKKITAFAARMILYYNYGSATVENDPEWVDYMVDMMLESKKKAEDICEEHGWIYPPKEFWNHTNYVTKGDGYLRRVISTQYISRQIQKHLYFGEQNEA